MVLNDKWYKALKWNTLIFLPALTTFVGTVGTIYEIDGINKLVALMTAFTALLGSLIGVSTMNYNKEHGDNEDGNV